MFKRRKGGGSRKSRKEKASLREQAIAGGDLSHVDKTLQGRGPLSNFDACIEACDALAANSGKEGFGPTSTSSTTSAADSDTESAQSPQSHTGTANTPQKVIWNGKESNVTLSDCSVLVSPDGALLFTSKGDGKLRSSTSDLSNPTSNPIPANASDDASLKDVAMGEEYQSAIVVGNDIQGDKIMNGFTCKGWNAGLVTLALRRSEDVLKSTSNFVEEIILSRKNYAASASTACVNLRDMIVDEDHTKTLSPVDKSRKGPLLFPGTSLYGALLAVEQYHSSVAEGEAHRWRMASTAMDDSQDGHGVLPSIHTASKKTRDRASLREKAMMDAKQRAEEAEATLRARKDASKKLWHRVEQMEEEVKRRVEDITRQRSRERESQRRKEENERQAAISAGQLESTVTQQEIWELVSQASMDMDSMSFAPTGLPDAKVAGPIDQSLATNQDNTPAANSSILASPLSPAAQMDIRAQVEDEIGLGQMQMAASEADEAVQDAAGALLNILSVLDTTNRSAAISAEACLLSAANAQVSCLKSLVELERASIQERMEHINRLEEKINEIDVRSDLNKFIQHEREEVPDGESKMGDTDDGGVASALAVLNSYSEGVGMGNVAGMAEKSTFSGWDDSEDDVSDREVVDREDIDDAVSLLFKEEANGEANKQALEEKVSFLEKIVKEKNTKARSYRASTCYAINNHRGKVAQLPSKDQFDGLCRVLDALLNGCDRETADVATAKMCMMLAQTFYITNGEEEIDDRSERIYPKSRLSNNPIWLDEDFWVQALYQCVTDSLTHSGVNVRVRVKKSEVTKRKIKWYDLSPHERLQAASQVHSVVFAQLGALAHSMIEFGCTIEQACAFVRRLSVRYQLPSSQRAMLLSHLIVRSNESINISFD